MGVERTSARAIVRLQFVSERKLGIVYKALMPEIEKPATVRSRANLEKNGQFLVLKIRANDTVALRAALNAYLRWINSVLGILEVLENGFLKLGVNFMALGVT